MKQIPDVLSNADHKSASGLFIAMKCTAIFMIALGIAITVIWYDNMGRLPKEIEPHLRTVMGLVGAAVFMSHIIVAVVLLTLAEYLKYLATITVITNEIA